MQATGIVDRLRSNRLGKKAAAGAARANASDWSLFTPTGRRKYLTQRERLGVIGAFERLPVERRLFALTLAWSGARVSEILALTPALIDVEAGLATIRTLKRRRLAVRQVPLPPAFVMVLDQAYSLREAQRDPARCDIPLWRFCRTTAWRFIKDAMVAAGVQGRPACPRGLRHGFGVDTVQAGVPLTLVQRWLGHARITTTAIYTEVSGAEERALATRYWEWTAKACS